MPVVIKKQPGDSTQQLISRFKRATMDDPGLDKVKQREMVGYQRPSTLRNIKRREQVKENARLRRKAKRLRGALK
jgi:ribosomal protein S21